MSATSEEASGTPEGEDVDELAEDFKSLANTTRLRLLYLLTRPRYGEEIAESLDTTRQNALQHLDRLEGRGFVRSLQGRRETGPVVEYQVVPQRLYALSLALADMGGLEPKGGPQRSDVDPTVQVGSPEDPEAKPEVASEPRLVVVHGPQAGHVLALEGQGPRWRIGRDEESDLVLPHDPYVSAHHAELQLHPQGHAVVDVHSANGTFVNFRRLPSGGRVPLEPGDVVRVGYTSLVYQRGSALPDVDGHRA